MKDRIAKSVFWMTWSKGLIQILSIVSTLFVARLLNPSDYGLIALAGIWTNTIALLAEMGLGTAIVQFQDLDDGELNACFWLTMGMAGTGYLSLYVAAPTIATWFATPMLAEVLRVVGLSLPLVAIRIVPDSLLRKRLAFDRISQAEIVSSVVTLTVLVGMALAGAGVWALVAGVLIMALVQSLVTFWFVRWRPGLRIVGKRLREVLHYSMATLGAKVGWAVYEQTDSFVLGKVSGEIVLGFYSMAMELATLPVNKISVRVNQLASPIMAELQGDLATMRASFLRVMRLVASLTIPLCVGMALVAEDLVLVALTDKWVAAVPLLQVLCFCSLFRSLEVLLPPVLFARYRTTFLFWWTASLLLIMPFAFLAGAAWMGGLGVALAWVVVYPFIMAWMAQEALKELEISWKTIWVQLRSVVRATLVMAAVVVVVHWTFPASDLMERLARLVLASGVGALAYGLVILSSGGLLVREIAEVAGWIFRRSWPLSAEK